MRDCPQTVTLAEALAEPIVRDLMMADGIGPEDLRVALTRAGHPAANDAIFAADPSPSCGHATA